MTDHIDTAKERERLALIAINEFEGAFCSCDGHRVHEDTCDFIMVRNTFRTSERLLVALDAERMEAKAERLVLKALKEKAEDALDAERAEIERLRVALAKIASYQAGSVDAGMSPWTARAALNPEGEA